MADSARLQILKEVERLLKTLSIMKVVTRNSNDVLSLPNYPAALVLGGEETLEPMLNDIDNIDWQIGVELYVKAESSLCDAQENALASVQQLLAANRLILSNKVHLIKNDGVQQWIPLNEDLTISGVMIPYVAKYQANRTNPYVFA